MLGLGVPELLIILLLVAMLFGFGRLPGIFGAVGRGIREFRASHDESDQVTPIKTKTVTQKPTTPTDTTR